MSNREEALAKLFEAVSGDADMREINRLISVAAAAIGDGGIWELRPEDVQHEDSSSD